MKKSLLFVIFILSLPVNAQDNCNPKAWTDEIILTEESKPLPLTALKNYNFSNILMDNSTCYLGYIGDDYQRFYIYFTEIEKISATEYSVKGESRVKDNECNFTGIIKISALRKLDQLYYGVDDEMKGQVKEQGYIIADFSLQEDKSQSASGEFKGRMVSYWYKDNSNDLLYDDLMADADGYCNNQYLGTWKSYRTGKSKKCAWGQYRIPCSGDLDIGVAEFSVNPDYEDKGWKTINEFDYCNE
ncbi:hypothetical protein GGR21_001115 [Dysgonomonas hofstadii]|uniref:Uncharacterized protein n=1 Tax=Dysgonomonas hofstadii TaxID=637886 RepID=A0A840CIR9_9BACT|nr:hypothetical protein [Dysgonomonas hofstadii]MBB4035226.1 hypothetical protein [Dysgonomonas hofstadii]